MIPQITESTASDVELAVAAAKQAFPAWRDLSAKERAAYLNKISSEIESNIYDLAAIESRDTGKPFTLALSMDIPRAVDNFSYFASAILHDQTETHFSGSGIYTSNENSSAIHYTQRRPIGVAGLIVPWNLPLYLLSWKVAPALALGNTVVIKPSELTPHTAYELAKICQRIGLPPGVLNIVNGTGKIAGNALVSHKDVPLISFTGGTATGKIVAATAAPLFKKVSLELGGKNATVVFEDADIDKAVSTAVRAAFTNQGQVCLCGSRLLVQKSIYDEFVQKFVEQAKKLQVLNPYIGYSDKMMSSPVVPPSQLSFGALISSAHREKIESYVKLAHDEGGKFLLGGDRPENLLDQFKNGFFYQPTLIAGLSPTSPVSVEEIFGPVVVVHPFDTEEEALSLANGTQYGLAGAVFTRDLQRAHRFAHRWETGMVWINTWLLRDLRTPFGGVKSSGVGFEGGKFSFDFWTHPKNICVKL